MDMIMQDESPANITDKIKNILFSKSADKIGSMKPSIGNAMFNQEGEGDEEV